jgi:hypothetical protein
MDLKKDYIETIEDIEREQKEEIKEAIKEGRLYDFIACNYWRIEDDLLHAVLFEAIATLKEEQNAELLDNLKEYRDF